MSQQELVSQLRQISNLNQHHQQQLAFHVQNMVKIQVIMKINLFYIFRTVLSITRQFFSFRHLSIKALMFLLSFTKDFAVIST